MKFYHVSHRKLREGTILTIGVYGERIRRHDFVKDYYSTYIKEEIFESIRSLNYPALPSRLNCVFLFAELATAKAFYGNKGRYNDYVYEVEIEEGEPLTVEMDLLCCDGVSYQEICNCAHKYWEQIRHPNSSTLEVLLAGKAKVKKMVLAPSNIWDL
ncbi:DUF2441 domain-containing protein [Aureispira anguillae]|uniref:DUF2441 domain-containing protein n=1 Tax=Aureispira anguillae TaxID=2864201 RepID=A0A915YC13_9BACT|nr:DUF2441 domain-containing protein [Aureispira anguillae]BDS10312.1 DUF2441 domain-containing protein [Aureispira anguillae]